MYDSLFFNAWDLITRSSYSGRPSWWYSCMESGLYTVLYCNGIVLCMIVRSSLTSSLGAAIAAGLADGVAVWNLHSTLYCIVMIPYCIVLYCIVYDSSFINAWDVLIGSSYSRWPSWRCSCVESGLHSEHRWHVRWRLYCQHSSVKWAQLFISFTQTLWSFTAVSGLVVRSRTSDSEVAGSSPTRTALE